MDAIVELTEALNLLDKPLAQHPLVFDGERVSADDKNDDDTRYTFDANLGRL